MTPLETRLLRIVADGVLTDKDKTFTRELAGYLRRNGPSAPEHYARLAVTLCARRALIDPSGHLLDGHVTPEMLDAAAGYQPREWGTVARSHPRSD